MTLPEPMEVWEDNKSDSDPVAMEQEDEDAEMSDLGNENIRVRGVKNGGQF